MKYTKKLLAVLLAVLMLAATFGCTLIPQETGGKGNSASSPAETSSSTDRADGSATAPLTDPSTEPATTLPATEPVDRFETLTALYGDLSRSLTASRSSVALEDDEVGMKLRASANLTREGDIWTYQAKITRLNHADEESFTSEETLDPVVGSVEELRESSASLFVWDRLLFSSPVFVRENLLSPEIAQDSETFTLTASVADDKLEEVFGTAWSGVSGMRIEIAFTASALVTMKLNYAAGDERVSVTVAYTY